MEEISITHFVNPHLFWFEIENSESKKEEVNQLERKLQNLAPKYRKATQKPYNCGDLTALLFIPWDKYVRASVAEVWRSEKTCKYIVWLLDHGFPVFTAEKELIPLPTEFHYRIGNIQRGGIANVLPVEKDVDLMNQRVKEWTERTHREMDRLLSGSYRIHMDIKNKMKKHVWCDLRIESTNGKICMASCFLAQQDLGEIIEADEFQKLCVGLKTLQQNPWEKPNKSSNYVKNEKIDLKHEIAKKKLIEENCEARQASQLKVNDWLERNFALDYANCDSVTTYDPLLDSDGGSGKANKHAMDELNNDMQKLFSPPSWYKPDNVINKFLMKMPAMPEMRAFDMSGEEAITIKTMKKDDNKHDVNKDLTSTKNKNNCVQDYASLITPKSSNTRIPLTVCNLDKKHEPYVSPFHDKDLKSTSTTSAQEKMNFLPAGYDVTQLVEYRNPNHWHRIKSMRYSKMTFIENKPKQQDFKNNENLLQQQQTKKDHSQEKKHESAEKSRIASGAMFLLKEQKQHWCELTTELTKIKICYNIDWSNFYVQLGSPENIRKYDELMEYLVMESDKLIPVYDSKLMIGADYIVRYDHFYYRAMLQNTWDTDGMQMYRFFFVDNGFVYEVVGDDNIRNDIFHSTRQLVDIMPFQAIHCSLVGLDQDSCKQIKFNVDANASLYAVACVMNKSIMEKLKINSYKIALFECEYDSDEDAFNEVNLPKSGISINTAFIKTKLAKCDEATLFYLDTDFGLHEKPITRSIAQRLLAFQEQTI